MADPCSADKVASRRGIQRFKVFKATMFASLSVFTTVLVALPSFASSINFLTAWDDASISFPTAGDDAVSGTGTLVVHVVPFDEVDLIIADDEVGADLDRQDLAVSSGIDGEVAVFGDSGELVASATIGAEMTLEPGEYIVIVEPFEPLGIEIPARAIKIQSDTLHDLVIELGGDTTSTAAIEELPVTTVPEPTTTTTEPAPPTVLRGIVTDATTGAPIAGAEVCIQGTEHCAQSDVSGTYVIENVVSGPTLIDLTAEGHVALYGEFVEIVAGATTNKFLALSPELPEGQARVILTWGEQPVDVDAYLVLPPNEEEKFIHYGVPNELVFGSILDLEDRDGHGPETITIESIQPGVYSYYVHALTASEDPNATQLRDSGAVVRLLVGSLTIATYSVPQSDGQWWHVFDFNPTTNDLIPVNLTADERPGAVTG